MQKIYFLRGFAVVLTVTLWLVGCAATSTISSTKTSAADFPEHAIELIVPFSSGGGLDLQAKALEAVAPRYLIQPLLPIHKTGKGGIIGWDNLMDAPADGYTVGVTSIELLLQPLYGETTYHYTSSLAPLAQIAVSPLLLVVRNDAPWQSVAELVAAAKRRPYEMKCGNGGIGSSAHLLGEALAKEAEIAVEQIPFHGGGDSTRALLNRQIQFVFVSAATFKEQNHLGELRALAVSGIKRSADQDLADIPTFQELGLNIALTNWRGVAVPKNVPPEIQAKLAEIFKQIILDPAFKEKVHQMGLEFAYLNPEESQKKWIEDTEHLAMMLKRTGILDKIKADKQKNASR